MLKTVDGLFRNGQIELKATPRDVKDNTPVIVTFLEPRLAMHREAKASLESPQEDATPLPQLAAFATGWHSRELDFYREVATDASILI
jgi:hypothetical protein